MSSIIAVGAVSVRPSVGACVRHAAYAIPREHTQRNSVHTQVFRFRTENSENLALLLHAGGSSEPIRSPLCHEIPIRRGGKKTHTRNVARIRRNSSAGKSQTDASLRYRGGGGTIEFLSVLRKPTDRLQSIIIIIDKYRTRATLGSQQKPFSAHSSAHAG